MFPYKKKLMVVFFSEFQDISQRLLLNWVRFVVLRHFRAILISKVWRRLKKDVWAELYWLDYSCEAEGWRLESGDPWQYNDWLHANILLANSIISAPIISSKLHYFPSSGPVNLNKLGLQPTWVQPDSSTLIGPDQPRYSPLIGGHLTGLVAITTHIYEVWKW